MPPSLTGLPRIDELLAGDAAKPASSKDLQAPPTPLGDAAAATDAPWGDFAGRQHLYHFVTYGYYLRCCLSP